MLSKIDFAGASFLMENFVNPWGRDDVNLDEIHNKSFTESESLRLWLFAVSKTGPNTIVLDVGAYSGLFSLLAVAAKGDIRSVAFEPSSVTYGRLVQDIIWNSMDLRVVPANLAVSNKLGTVILSHQYGPYTMSSGETVGAAADVDHTQCVPAIKLDVLLEARNRRPPGLNSAAVPIDPFDAIGPIKIDVEGHEVAVLQGATRIIRKYRPIFICESWNVKADRAIESVLKPEGYVLSRITEERNVLLIPEEQCQDWFASYQVWKEENAASLEIQAEATHTLVPTIGDSNAG
jgi:FkbM family methyltransferase